MTLFQNTVQPRCVELGQRADHMTLFKKKYSPISLVRNRSKGS
jgi:hypothetical protein